MNRSLSDPPAIPEQVKGLAALLAIELENVEAISRLPVLRSGSATASPTDIAQGVQHITEIWAELVIKRNDLPKSLEFKGAGTTASGNAVEAMAIALCYVNLRLLVSTLLTRCDEFEGNELTEVGRAMHTAIQRMCDTAPKKDEWIVRVSSSYLAFVVSLIVSRALANVEEVIPSWVGATSDAHLHGSLLALHMSCDDLPARSAKARRVLAESLRQASTIDAAMHYRLIHDAALAKAPPVEDWTPLERLGRIRLSDLPMVANRRPEAIRKYGETHLARILETELMLVFQSLGFQVVRAATGRAQVDLYCISGTGDRFAFLVEAKSSSKPYNLPSKDERALRDYVRDIRSSIEGLPQIDFAILVGGAASPQLGPKLARLEAEVHLPIRFLRAVDLVTLRAGIRGPVKASEFRSHLNAAPHVLSTSFVDGLIECEEGRRRAYEAMVSTALAKPPATSSSELLQAMAQDETALRR